MRKCPKCGAEVEPGSLYCPNCLQEIQWVSEYNTVETLMEKETRRQKRSHPKKHLEERIERKSLLKWLVSLSIVVLCVCIFRCVDHSYLVQYSLASQAYRDKDYDRALEYADKALTISPGKGKAAVLLARVLEEEGDLSGAVKVLEGNLSGHEESLIYCKQLIRLYEKAGKPEKIKKLLLDTGAQSVREEFAGYLCKDPQIHPQTGTYDESLEVSIEEEKGVRYYYTLDGTRPTTESELYQGPVPVGEGVTEIYVIGENGHGIISDVIYRKYTVIPKEPEAPEVLPESGEYGKDTDITVEVPDGFKAYYAFDERPTENSMEYRAPVKMPVGEHTFYVILIGVNDRVSEMASRWYYLYE